MLPVSRCERTLIISLNSEHSSFLSSMSDSPSGFLIVFMTHIREKTKRYCCWFSVPNVCEGFLPNRWNVSDELYIINNQNLKACFSFLVDEGGCYHTRQTKSLIYRYKYFMFADSCEIKYKKIGSKFVFIWGFLPLVCLVVFYFSHFITEKTAFSNSITKYLHFLL